MILTVLNVWRKLLHPPLGFKQLITLLLFYNTLHLHNNFWWYLFNISTSYPAVGAFPRLTAFNALLQALHTCLDSTFKDVIQWDLGAASFDNLITHLSWEKRNKSSNRYHNMLLYSTTCKDKVYVQSRNCSGNKVLLYLFSEWRTLDVTLSCVDNDQQSTELLAGT